MNMGKKCKTKQTKPEWQKQKEKEQQKEKVQREKKKEFRDGRRNSSQKVPQVI